ncbi:MAG: RagB/SusD family nutrient uptake outer membrane protein [Paludibacter sp.]
MKINKLITYITIFIFAAIIPACQDMFAPEVDNTYGEERAQSSPTSPFGFLNTAYVALPTTYDFTECATDDAVINDPLSGYVQMVGGSWGPMFDPTSIWTSSYRAIVNVNKFLTYAPTMKISWSSAKDDSTYRKRWIGEAYGMRAYHHFQLLRCYGGTGISGKVLGIPYLKEMVDLDPNVWGNIVRPDYKVTVESIAQDLDSAILKLPMDYAGDDRVLGIKNKNRFTKRIAMAVKAQLYLQAASPKFNGGSYNKQYCDSAIKYSATLINSIGGLGAITGTFKKTQFYYSDADQSNLDILWRTNQVTEATTATAMALTIEAKNYPPSRMGKGQVNPTQEFVDAFPAVNGYPISDIVKSGYNAAKPYLLRDPRLDSCVIRDGGKSGSAIIKTSKDDSKNGIENVGATRTGYYLKKLLRPDFNIAPPLYSGKKTIRPLIRYSELYLIYAEAATAAYNADETGIYTYSARDIIKAIRKRAGVGTSNSDAYATNLSTANFMDLVRNERRIELAFEGFRFWDLRRWGLEVNGVVTRARILTSGGAPEFLPITEEPRSFMSFKYYAPIPNSEILKCPKLEQNSAN